MIDDKELYETRMVVDKYSIVGNQKILPFTFFAFACHSFSEGRTPYPPQAETAGSILHFSLHGLSN
jgi:hypothetical protein